MTHKERLLTAVNHEEPDRVPICAWYTPEAEKKVLRRLGVESEEFEIPDFSRPDRYDGARQMMDQYGEEYGIMGGLACTLFELAWYLLGWIEAARVKRDFGDRLTLWGTVDIQEVLPFGTPEDVAQEVKLRVRTAGQGGGLILSPAHNIQPEVPLENILAFYSAAKQYGRYPISAA